MFMFKGLKKSTIYRYSLDILLNFSTTEHINEHYTAQNLIIAI